MAKHHDHCCDHDHHDDKLKVPVVFSARKSNLPKENLIQTVFDVAGMDCADEVTAIQAALVDDAIAEVNANLMSGTVTIFHLPSMDAAQLRTKVESAGVRVRNGKTEEKHLVQRGRVALVGISGAIVGLGLACEFFLLWQTFALALYISSVMAGGILVFPKAIRSLRHFRLDINVLMTVAVVGAFLIDQHSEAATVVFLFSLSELLESYSVNRARRAIREVLDLSPQTALLLAPDQVEQEVPLADLKVGDRILVKSGSRIPLDGVVRVGNSLVNQAPLTGEAVPKKKTVGDSVLAGTVNESGSLEVEVQRLFRDSKASQIIRMIEDAQKEKAPTQRFVDTFAKYYTPTVFIAALLVMLVPPLLAQAAWSTWIYRALVLLVIACPCALVISTPVSIVSGLAAMARRGVLIKGGVYLEILGKIRAIAVDKTGTITVGKPLVHDVHSLNGMSAKSIIQIAASLEKFSSHPLAAATMKHASDMGVSPLPATNFNTVVGYGVEAQIEGHHFFLGNHRFAHDTGICTPDLETLLEQIEAKALSIIVVGHKPHANCPGEVLGVLAVGDKIRENAAAAIAKIRGLGMQKIIMLSGDNQRTAESVAKLAAISDVKGDLLPEDKVHEMKELVREFGTVAMIGDGINDTPALAEASLGIAMGAAGTDAALETADVALMKDDLEEVAMAIHQGRRVLSIIKFNIFFALGLKAIFLILALFGQTNLWMAVAADTGASLLVISNALRLLRVRA